MRNKKRKSQFDANGYRIQQIPEKEFFIVLDKDGSEKRIPNPKFGKFRTIKHRK